MLREAITAYAQNRANSAPLPSGSAPYTSSEHFKLKPGISKPVAKDWTYHLSTEGSTQSGSTLKTASLATSSIPTVSLGTARPASEFYPWEELTTTAVSSGSTSTGDSALVSISCSRREDAYDLAVAMNYGYAAGSPQLLRFVTEHVEIIHNPPYQDWESCLTCGTTSAIEILFRMLCNRGDCIIVEEYTYPGGIGAAKRMGLSVLSVCMDEMGLLADDLDRQLSQWNGSLRKPSVLYTIPSGQNPTGVTQPLERRRAIYEVAERHDLLIVEDDPYHFLQLDISSIVDFNSQTAASDSDAYLQRLPPSYLSLDISGRVLRLDTTSKFLAPGLRCGWITASSQLIAKFITATQFSTGAPSGPSQIMMYKLLDDAWGHDGFINWLVNLSHRYENRLATMLLACEKYLPSGICKWTVPRSGMFLWIQIDWSQHPTLKSDKVDWLLNSCDMREVEDGIYQICRSYGVQVTKGSWFAATEALSDKMFFRVTFAAAPEEDLTVAIERFGRAVREEFSEGVS